MNPNESTNVSSIRTITESVTQASASSDTSDSGYDSNVPVHDQTDSLLSEIQLRVIQVVGGERGETLRRNLVRDAQALQRTRSDAHRTSAAMRLDVQEYLSLLEGRFAAEFREIGADIGRLMEKGKRRESSIVRKS
jgi:hypothetical protein